MARGQARWYDSQAAASIPGLFVQGMPIVVSQVRPLKRTLRAFVPREPHDVRQDMPIETLVSRTSQADSGGAAKPPWRPSESGAAAD
jgi:hypothetical protein